MRILMLHGVTREEAPALERQLRWLLRTFEVVSLADLHDRLAAGSSRGGEVALTFDDGLRNNATVVAPMLARLRVPATFFLCPGLVGSGRWLWNHEARARRQRLSDVSVHPTIEAMKALDPDVRARAERALQEATPDFTPTAGEREAFDVMDWDDVKALPELVTVGSHTMDHPILTTLPDDALDRQLRESRAVLEAELQRPIPWFCYPNGAEDARVRAAVRRHYDAAVTTVPGFVRSGDDRYGLSRIGGTDTVAELAWRFHRP